MPSNSATRIHESTFTFHLTPQQATEIAMSYNSIGKNEYGNQVQVLESNFVQCLLIVFLNWLLGAVKIQPSWDFHRARGLFPTWHQCQSQRQNPESTSTLAYLGFYSTKLNSYFFRTPFLATNLVLSPSDRLGQTTSLPCWNWVPLSATQCISPGLTTTPETLLWAFTWWRNSLRQTC